MVLISRRLYRWLPATVVLIGALIYGWVVVGAPGTAWLTGPKVDVPGTQRAYPGRDHLERVDPMGVVPDPLLVGGERPQATKGTAARLSR